MTDAFVDKDAPPARAALAKRLRLARISAGLTQTQVADLCGVSGAYISCIERGTRMVSARMAASLLAVLAPGRDQGAS